MGVPGLECPSGVFREGSVEFGTVVGSKQVKGAGCAGFPNLRLNVRGKQGLMSLESYFYVCCLASVFYPRMWLHYGWPHLSSSLSSSEEKEENQAAEFKLHFHPANPGTFCPSFSSSLSYFSPTFTDSSTSFSLLLLFPFLFCHLSLFFLSLCIFVAFIATRCTPFLLSIYLFFSISSIFFSSFFPSPFSSLQIWCFSPIFFLLLLLLLLLLLFFLFLSLPSCLFSFLCHLSLSVALLSWLLSTPPTPLVLFLFPLYLCTL